MTGDLFINFFQYLDKLFKKWELRVKYLVRVDFDILSPPAFHHDVCWILYVSRE